MKTTIEKFNSATVVGLTFVVLPKALADLQPDPLA